jgi:hypothetical protein
LKYFFIGTITLVLFLCPAAYGEVSEIEINWIIEGQHDNLPTMTEKNDVKEIIEFDDETEIFSEFITNNQYMVGDTKIDIHSVEGQLLNKLLLEQKKISKENFLHMIHYLDRYSDGYIELAEALLDPVNQQRYQVNGRVYDKDINSNLEYFLFERGYDTNNLESIPNQVFSPTKYDDARALMSKEIDSGNGERDLRKYIPNYVDVNDPEIINEKMTANLFDQISNTRESMFSSENKGVFSKSGVSENFFGESFENMLIPSTSFENTEHAVVKLGQTFETPSNTFDPLEIIPVLILSSAVLISALFGYTLLRKTRAPKHEPKILVETNSVSISIEQKAKEMLDSSTDLFENNFHKEAFEKLGQTIRFYYCNKLNLSVQMTSFEIIPELRKSRIDDFESITKWLLLCGSVEFTKHQSHKTEFDNIVSSFSKHIS